MALAEDVNSGNFFSAAGAPQTDGKIVVASGDGTVRFNPNGTRDMGFGVAGLANQTTALVNIVVQVKLQSNGKIVVGGGAIPPTCPNPVSEFAAIRFNTNGSVDPTFGTDGQVRTAIGSNAAASAIAIQADGRIVLAGYTRAIDPWPTTLALTRYYGDPPQ